jgi:hypothetical protein
MDMSTVLSLDKNEFNFLAHNSKISFSTAAIVEHETRQKAVSVSHIDKHFLSETSFHLEYISVSDSFFAGERVSIKKRMQTQNHFNTTINLCARI